MPDPDPITEGPILVTFESDFNAAPPGTPATPRPPGRPRLTDIATDPPTEADTAFARELAQRVLEYVKDRPAGLTAEQLAALVQQLLARRSA
jgi:hypothetical protein